MAQIADNFYKNANKKEKNEVQNLEKERLQALNELEVLSKACFNSENFVLFRRQYEQLEKKTIDLLINFSRNYFNSKDISTDAYAMVVLKYVTQISTFRMMIDQIGTKK